MATPFAAIAQRQRAKGVGRCVPRHCPDAAFIISTGCALALLRPLPKANPA